MKRIILAAAAAAVFAVPASAEITWTPTAGGFVGKGDVQDPLGLNNAQLQSQASSISFTYSVERSYDVACYKEETVGKIRELRRTDREFARSAPISASVAYDVRQGKSQVTGFNLSGLGASLPAIVPTCPGGWNLDFDDPMGVIQNLTTSGGSLSANGVALPTYFGG